MVLSVGNESKKTKGKDERMDVTAHRRKMVLWVLTLTAGLVLAAAGTAWAQPPITETLVLKSTDSFSDEPITCEDELYTQTLTGHTLVHITAAGEATGDEGFYLEEVDRSFLLPVHLKFGGVGKVVAVPLDGTGPTYKGHFTFYETLNVREATEDAFIGTFSHFNNFVAHGSDGSKVRVHELTHFTVNANGEVTVFFDKPRIVCSA
jgi:hypothetical protein